MAGRTFYLDLGNTSGVADDGNDGLTTETPWVTCARVNSSNNLGLTPAGCLNNDDDVLNICGTGRGDPLKVKPQGARFIVQQWAGQAKAIIHGGIIVDKTTATSPATDVYEIPLPAGTCHNLNNRTLLEGIAATAFDWDTQIDQRGSNYGCFEKAQSAADVLDATTEVFQSSWYFTPAGTAGTNQDGSGTIRIRTTTGEFANLAAFKASAKVLTYAIGNFNGIEIGGQRYVDVNFTQGSPDVDYFANAGTLDGVDAYFWPDNGWRSQFSSGGLGIDVGALYTTGVNSMGYAIRPGAWVNGTIRNLLAKTGGYHDCMFVGERCSGNSIVNCTLRDGHGNMLSGGSSGGFYCSDFGNGSKFITGCRAYSCVNHKHTLLGRTTELASDLHYGTGFFAIPIGQPFLTEVSASATPPIPITVTAATHASATHTTLTLSVALPNSYKTTGQHFWLALRKRTGDCLNMGAVAYLCEVVDSTHVSIGFDNSGGTGTATAALAVFPDYDGFISHTNATANNRVTDIEYHNIITYSSGWVGGGALCGGRSICGGSLGAASLPSNGFDSSNYEVKAFDCQSWGATGNPLDSDESVAYVRCKFHLDNLGSGGTANTGNGAMGSTSGTHYILYEACEFVAAMGTTNVDASGVKLSRCLFNASTTNHLFFTNPSVLGTGTATNTKILFNFAGGSFGSLMDCYGGIWAFAANAGGSLQLLTMQTAPVSADLAPAFLNMQNNLYFGPAGYFPIGFPGPNSFTQWIAGGWFNGGASDGPAMDRGGIVLAVSPFSDTTGATGLALTPAAQLQRKLLSVHAPYGSNHQRYGGQYGSNQTPAGMLRMRAGSSRRGLGVR